MLTCTWLVDGAAGAGVAQQLWVSSSPGTGAIPAAQLCQAAWVSPCSILCQEPWQPALPGVSSCLPITALRLGPVPSTLWRQGRDSCGDWELTASLPRAVISAQARCHRAPCSSCSEDGGQRQLLFCLGFNSCRAVVWLFFLETITLLCVSCVPLLKVLSPSAGTGASPLASASRHISSF